MKNVINMRENRKLFLNLALIFKNVINNIGSHF